jgi:8-oxo-dGTP diphosphatase
MIDHNALSDRPLLGEPDLDKYKKPTVMVDVAIFTLQDKQLKVLLVKRGIPPFQGMWALPGGALHVEEDNTLEAAALRELYEETGVSSPYLEQLYTYGSRDRDPRDWVVSVAYFALVSADSIAVQYGTDAADARWWSVYDSGVNIELAFDHQRILEDAVHRLRSKLEYTSIAVHLLPSEFTLAELQHTYELLLQSKLDKSSFRQRVKGAGIVVEVKGKMRTGSNRPAQLYRFCPNKKRSLFFPRSLAKHAKK